jgi:hypothetical protein
METYFRITTFLLSVIVLFSCSGLQVKPDEKYQPLGPAVLAANGLLLIEHPHDCPEDMSGDDYKGFLKEDYSPMYDRLLPYSVRIQTKDGDCIVTVFDGQKLIFTDWLCTEGRIDCWSYNGECNPDTARVTCDK